MLIILMHRKNIWKVKSYREKMRSETVPILNIFFGGGVGGKQTWYRGPPSCHLIDLVIQGFTLAELLWLLGIASNIQRNSDIFLPIF